MGLAFAGMGVAMRIEEGFELGASDDVSCTFFGFAVLVFAYAAARALFRLVFPPPEDV
ncbi:MAG: hypothetical protein MJ138_03795 [Kiritimatiellae bacterium]|nr:hypothetical protein [Kiritimatiellia bacterium]